MHLHFTQSLEPLEGAGLGYSALGMHQGFLENEIESHLLSTRAASYKKSWPNVHQYPRKGPTKLFYSNELRNRAKRWVSQAEAIHGHGFYVYPNWVLGRETRRQNKPLVYHVHGFLDPWILKRSKLKKRLVHLLFENANFRHVSFWRALSKKEADQIRAYRIQAPIEVLPNGVHMPVERSADELKQLRERFPKQRPKRMLFLSRIHQKKGLDILIPAFAKLGAQAKDWEVAIFGPDEGGYQAVIEQKIVKLGLQDQCRFYGSVSGDDKEAAFRSGDLFVLPSYSEGFPMAVLEATAYGLPVVQTTECNFPELSTAGGAWECQPEEASLKQTLEEALSADDTERSQRGMLGHKLVEASYAWKNIAQQLVSACERYC